MARYQMEIQDLPPRIERKIEFEPNTGCWLWTGAVNGSPGYAVFKLKGRQTYVHRFVAELSGIDFGAGLESDHICRVRCCVNPAHIQAVTRHENLNRRIGYRPVRQSRRCVAAI